MPSTKINDKDRWNRDHLKSLQNASLSFTRENLFLILFTYFHDNSGGVATQDINQRISKDQKVA